MFITLNINYYKMVYNKTLCDNLIQFIKEKNRWPVYKSKTAKEEETTLARDVYYMLYTFYDLRNGPKIELLYEHLETSMEYLTQFISLQPTEGIQKFIRIQEEYIRMHETPPGINVVVGDYELGKYRQLYRTKYTCYHLDPLSRIFLEYPLRPLSEIIAEVQYVKLEKFIHHYYRYPTRLDKEYVSLYNWVVKDKWYMRHNEKISRLHQIRCQKYRYFDKICQNQNPIAPKQVIGRVKPDIPTPTKHDLLWDQLALGIKKEISNMPPPTHITFRTTPELYYETYIRPYE
jgi:hypothetical protein